VKEKNRTGLGPKQAAQMRILEIFSDAGLRKRILDGGGKACIPSKQFEAALEPMRVILGHEQVTPHHVFRQLRGALRVLQRAPAQLDVNARRRPARR
jgi:hypothetical protein